MKRRKYTKDIVNDYGVEMTVALRLKGDRWGCNDCLVWDEEQPIVEVYLKGTDYLISDYYYTDFFRNGKGILLDGANPQYTLEDRNKEELMDWVDDIGRGLL